MASTFGWIVAVFAVAWVALAIRGIVHEHRRGERGTWAVWTGGFLILLGALGFFGSGLVALGMIRLPSSLEWPPGYSRGVVTSADGKHIVPLQNVGRVQLYSPEWRFITGWQVNAEGGEFKAVSAAPSTIEVFTARGSHHYVYDETGNLLRIETFTGPYDYSAETGRSMVVPTFPLLWPFTSPFLCVGLVVVGGLLLNIARRVRGVRGNA